MALLAKILALLFLLLAVYCAIDPFKHSSIAEFPNFVAHKVDMYPWSELPTEKDSENLLQKSEIKFLNQVQGPESIAFDPHGRGQYTGLADGRIVFWNGESWTDFAYTSQTDRHVYLNDAYLGLMKVGPEGVPLKFTNDLDIDDDRNIYFTDSSVTYQRRNFIQLVSSGDNTGRLLKYNPNTKETTVLIVNLQFPNGLTMSKDNSNMDKIQYLLSIGGRLHGMLVKYSPEGKLLQILEDREGKVVKAASEVEERDGKLWISSVLMPFVAVYQLD
ncbi:hypothetical protein MKW92_015960 [Papaver armeniacum]|nr:hypothetical protein MKW92_015960 [Papaver armeniacum]